MSELAPVKLAFPARTQYVLTAQQLKITLAYRHRSHFGAHGKMATVYERGKLVLDHGRSPMNPEPRVYVVEDEPRMRALINKSLDAAGLKTECYASAEEFLACYSPDNPGCLLLDMMMPGMNGLELQQQLKELGNITPIIFLSGSDEIGMAVSAIKAGAMDFIEKPFETSNVVARVNRALLEDQRARLEQLQHVAIENRYAQLTARESEVMSWMVRGKSNKQIAAVLDISTRTVEVHRSNVLSKMQVDSLAELVRISMRLQSQ